jgi:glycosyltransferase involved in cell wall biosynthesis
VEHVQYNEDYYAYGPYVREMNLWMQQFSSVLVVAPLKNDEINPIDLKYNNQVVFWEVPSIRFTSLKQVIISSVKLPFIFYRIIAAMKCSSNIHLRCPGNIGLLGAAAQVCFPKKKKIAKYAGNWDPNSKQPFSYRLQKYLLSNSLLSKDMTVLVYGNWPNQSLNVKSFFTATYSEAEKSEAIKSPFDQGVKLAFVGTLSHGKNPLISLEVLHNLRGIGVNAELNICGDGALRTSINDEIAAKGLSSVVKLLGNVDAKKVMEVLKEAHFLIFLSDSEGWPKVVAESMWWGCIPVTKPISCVPWMLGNGERGGLTDGAIQNVVEYILDLIKDPVKYEEIKKQSIAWSREYTLNRFEEEIKSLC